MQKRNAEVGQRNDNSRAPVSKVSTICMHVTVLKLFLCFVFMFTLPQSFLGYVKVLSPELAPGKNVLLPSQVRSSLMCVFACKMTATS